MVTLRSSLGQRATLIDRGTNGYVTGRDMHVIKRGNRILTPNDIVNHTVRNLTLVTAGAVARSSRGELLVLPHAALTAPGEWDSPCLDPSVPEPWYGRQVACPGLQQGTLVTADGDLEANINSDGNQQQGTLVTVDGDLKADINNAGYTPDSDRQRHAVDGHPTHCSSSAVIGPWTPTTLTVWVSVTTPPWIALINRGADDTDSDGYTSDSDHNRHAVDRHRTRVHPAQLIADELHDVCTLCESKGGLITIDDDSS